jgi:hypothetical protein
VLVQQFMHYFMTLSTQLLCIHTRTYMHIHVVGLERGPLSLVSTTEELLERKSSGSGLEIREYVCGDPLR